MVVFLLLALIAVGTPRPAAAISQEDGLQSDSLGGGLYANLFAAILESANAAGLSREEIFRVFDFAHNTPLYDTDPECDDSADIIFERGFALLYTLVRGAPGSTSPGCTPAVACSGTTGRIRPRSPRPHWCTHWEA